MTVEGSTTAARAAPGAQPTARPEGRAEGSARVVIPGVLRDLAGGAHELTVPLEGPVPLREALDRAFAPWPTLGTRVRDERGEIRRHVNVFVDGRDAKRAEGSGTPVVPGSTVHVINAVSGG